MKTSIMKLRITNLIQKQNAAQNRETNMLKNEAPAHLQGKMKTSTKGIYMFVSQKNKLIEDAFPDGDVLHIEKIDRGIAHGCI